jgi:hypothetical protein
MKKIIENPIVAFVSSILLFATMMFYVFTSGGVASGAVSQGHEYNGTTTSTGRFPTLVSLTTASYGSLGSVVVTGAAAGTINIYDATTSNASLRDASQSTSTILIATLPNSAAAGTYAFDRVYTRGLLVEITGTMPTTTITWR